MQLSTPFQERWGYFGILACFIQHMVYWCTVAAFHNCWRGPRGSWSQCHGDISQLLAVHEGLAHQGSPQCPHSHPPGLQFEKFREHYNFFLSEVHSHRACFCLELKIWKQKVFGLEMLTFHSLLITGAERWIRSHMRLVFSGASCEGRHGLLRPWIWLSPVLCWCRVGRCCWDWSTWGWEHLNFSLLEV